MIDLKDYNKDEIIEFSKKNNFVLELSFDNKFKQSPKAGLDFNPSIDTLKITLKK